MYFSNTPRRVTCFPAVNKLWKNGIYEAPLCGRVNRKTKPGSAHAKRRLGFEWLRFGRLNPQPFREVKRRLESAGFLSQAHIDVDELDRLGNEAA